MATFNGGRFIEKQLASILCQLSVEDEVIISDDGSTDDTLARIMKFDDFRIKLLHHTSRTTITDNFENALKKATGRYVFLADQDDVWESRKVETVLPLLRSFDLVVTDCRILDVRGMVMSRSYFKSNGSGAGLVKNLIKNSYIGCCTAFTRGVLVRSLPFPRCTPMHDWWLGLVAECTGTTCFCEEKLVRHRHHGNNASATALGKSPYGSLIKIYFRLCLVISLMVMWWNHCRAEDDDPSLHHTGET